MTTAVTVVFAISGGIAVGNLYWAQPLLELIGDSFAVTAALSGLIVTVTQIGYALGVLLIVPLGDMVERRRLIPVIMIVSAASLLGTALAPGFGVLLIAMALIGLTTVSGQLLTPLAGDLAHDDQRGRTIGTVAAGLMLGILISRAVSGLVADTVGWRGVFVLAAALTTISAVLLVRFIPRAPRRAAVPYGRLLSSVFTSIGRYPAVRVLLVLGFCVMSVFIMFWTGLTFLLSAAPFGFSVTQIGLTSLVGVAGAVAAQQVGRLFDRGLTLPAVAVGLVLTLVGLVLAALGQRSIVIIVVAVAIVSVGVQCCMVLLQTTMLSVDPAARSRLNTIFVVGNFIGGAIGSAVAGTSWERGGWSLLVLIAAGLIMVALITLRVGRRIGFATSEVAGLAAGNQ